MKFSTDVILILIILRCHMFSSGRKTRSKRFTDVRNEFMELFVICFNEGREEKNNNEKKRKKKKKYGRE